MEFGADNVLFSAPPSAPGVMNPGPVDYPGSSDVHKRSAAHPMMSDPQMSAAMNLGLNVGQRLLDEGLGKAQEGWSRYVSVGGVKGYFRVNNSYVANKIKLLLWPFTQKRWERLTVDVTNETDKVIYRPPRDDVFAPDLYIPCMAFCTYVLLVCVVLGFGKKFTPEALGMTSSSVLATVGFEVGLVRFGCYLLDVTSLSLLDIVCYCSYTLVGVDFSMLSGIALGSYAYHISILYCALASAFFLLKTSRPLFTRTSPSHQSNSVGAAQELKRNRQYLLLAVAFVQIPVALFLGMGPINVPVPSVPVAAGVLSPKIPA